MFSVCVCVFAHTCTLCQFKHIRATECARNFVDFRFLIVFFLFVLVSFSGGWMVGISFEWEWNRRMRSMWFVRIVAIESQTDLADAILIGGGFFFCWIIHIVSKCALSLRPVIGIEIQFDRGWSWIYKKNITEDWVESSLRRGQTLFTIENRNEGEENVPLSHIIWISRGFKLMKANFFLTHWRRIDAYSLFLLKLCRWHWYDVNAGRSSVNNKCLEFVVFVVVEIFKCLT